MESLDRPYGDADHEHLTVHPELPPEEPQPDTGDLVRDEEAAAAAEARAIGGRPFDDPVRTNDEESWGRDPAFVPVEEAGGGWAEGFEQSEGLLLEHAYNAPEPELTPDGFDLDDPGTDVDPDAEDLVDEELEAAERGDLPPMERRDEARLGAGGGGGGRPGARPPPADGASRRGPPGRGGRRGGRAALHRGHLRPRHR